MFCWHPTKEELNHWVGSKEREFAMTENKLVGSQVYCIMPTLFKNHTNIVGLHWADPGLLYCTNKTPSSLALSAIDRRAA